MLNKKKHHGQPEVRADQVWKDNDPRFPDRYINIKEIKDGRAYYWTCLRFGGVTDWTLRSSDLKRFRGQKKGFSYHGEVLRNCEGGQN